MSLNRRILEDDALAIAPPAAFEANRLVEDAGALTKEVETLMTDIGNKVEIAPHDRIEIIRLVEAFKNKTFRLYTRALEAKNAIEAGR